MKANVIKDLLVNKENIWWCLKNTAIRTGVLFSALFFVWEIPSAFGVDLITIINQYINYGTIYIALILLAISAMISFITCLLELKKMTHKIVKTERENCKIEIRVADSYITNAFENYPDCAMIMGSNKAFWFRDPQKKALYSDMAKKLAELNIGEEDLQNKIDAELKRLHEEGVLTDADLDPNKKSVELSYNKNGQKVFETRKNYRLGVMIKISFIYNDDVKYFYLVTNSEVAEQESNEGRFRVTHDRFDTFLEHYYSIWEYFMNEPLKETLVMPLIGTGVAGESYSNLEVFSKIVDLYYEYLRNAMKEGKEAPISNLVISIRSNTAIESPKDERHINLKTAFEYLDFRNAVKYVKDKR